MSVAPLQKSINKYEYVNIIYNINIHCWFTFYINISAVKQLIVINHIQTNMYLHN